MPLSPPSTPNYTFAQLATDIAALDDAPDGLVVLAGLLSVLGDIKGLLLQNGIKYCADLTALHATAGTEANTCIVPGKGCYRYTNDIAVLGEPALGPGAWLRVTPGVAFSELTDISLSNPVDGQVLRFNASIGKFENGNQAIAGLAWSGITGTPTTLAGYGISNAAVTGNATVAGTLGVNGNTTLSAVSISGNATVAGTLGVAGTTTLSNVGVTGNATVAGTLGVAGTTSLGVLSVSGASTLTGNVAASGNVAAGGTVSALQVSAGSGGLSSVGAATLQSTAAIAGALTLGSSLNGTAIAANTLLGSLEIGESATGGSGGLIVRRGTSTFYGAATFNGPGGITSGGATISGQVSLTALASYPNNAAALAAFLGVGQLYRNGDNVCVVH